jgi:hypothetical protein
MSKRRRRDKRRKKRRIDHDKQDQANVRDYFTARGRIEAGDEVFHLAPPEFPVKPRAMTDKEKADRDRAGY